MTSDVSPHNTHFTQCPVITQASLVRGRHRTARLSEETVLWNEYDTGERPQRQSSFRTVREAKAFADGLNS